MNDELKPMVVTLTIGALIAYILTFGYYSYQFLENIGQYSRDDGNTTLPTKGAIDYIWTTASVLVGSIVAVALGQPDPNSRFSLPSVSKIIVAYAWAWTLVGAVAICIWIFAELNAKDAPLIIRNAATAFVGLAVPIITAFLRDGDASIHKK